MNMMRHLALEHRCEKCLVYNRRSETLNIPVDRCGVCSKLAVDAAISTVRVQSHQDSASTYIGIHFAWTVGRCRAWCHIELVNCVSPGTDKILKAFKSQARDRLQQRTSAAFEKLSAALPIAGWKNDAERRQRRILAFVNIHSTLHQCLNRWSREAQRDLGISIDNNDNEMFHVSIDNIQMLDDDRL